MEKLNKNSAGLAVGLFFGLAHLVWAVMVALAWAKPFLDWILHLHFMDLRYSLNPFAFATALWLVIITFIVGYVFGWALAAVWNAVHKS